MRPPLALLQGTVDILVLKALSFGSQHGYGISRWIRERSEGALGLEDAGLYQALHRLERRGQVTASWGASENNRRARYYTLTPAGHRHLAAERKEFERMVGAIRLVLANA